jgi:hypothetical protein
LRRFGTAGQQPAEEDIQVLGDLHRQPYLTARGADIDGNVKHQHGLAITLCEQRTTDRRPLAVIAPHQRLHLW